jgi:wyosine [tRNA(Phe)-imidazoG37] synthetase (radical SAM superfamily)
MTGPVRWLPVASRGFSNFLSGHPLCVSFEITHACNASCDHCHRGGPAEENQAPPEKFARISRELRPSVIQVSGGEPLLREDVKEVIQALQQPDGTPLTILVTNGSLLTPGLFRELASSKTWSHFSRPAPPLDAERESGSLLSIQTERCPPVVSSPGITPTKGC